MAPHPAEPYILVVDDFEDGREMLAEYLTFRHFRVIEAVDGAQALDIARREPPGVVLMDMSMVGLDGWEATRQLKADPATRDVLVIAVTAHALANDAGRARAAGCDGFVAKPFDLALLANALARILQDGRSALTVLETLQHSAQRDKATTT